MIKDLSVSDSTAPGSSDEDDDAFINSNISYNRFHDHGLLDKLQKISNMDMFKSLDSGYYSCNQFSQKLKPLEKVIELSVFHLNIRSLNSKQRSFCQLMELLDFDF